MQVPCLVCKNPATRICKHPECQEYPFFCNSECIKKSAQLLHTHNGQLNFIPLTIFTNKVTETQKLKSNNPHEEYFEKIKAKVQTIKQTLDRATEEHCQGLQQDITLKSTEWGQQFFKRLNSEEMNVKGKEICQFMKGESVFENELTLVNGLKYFQKQFQEILDQFSKSLLSLLPIKVRRQKANQLLQEGRILSEQKLYQVALERYVKSLQFCPYTHSTYFNIGSCYHQLKNSEKATENYLKCLELNPFEYVALNNLGILYDKTNQHQKAVAYFTKAVDMDRTRKNGYKNRAESYLKLKMYKQGLEDYEKLLALEPQNQDYREKKVAIMKLIAEQAQSAQNMRTKVQRNTGNNPNGVYDW